MPEDFRFVLARETEDERIETIKGCDTEEEMRNLYRNLLIQSGLGSGYFPYQRVKRRTFVQLLDLAIEVEEEFREERARNRNLDISRYVM